MSFSVSIDGIEWFLEFGPDSANLIVKDLVQEMTISSPEIPLATWNLLSERQEFFNNPPARFQNTSKQQGTMELRDELYSSIGTQDIDTSKCQMSDLEVIEFHWEDLELSMDALFRRSIDTPFPLQLSTYWNRFNDWKPDSDWWRERTLLLFQQLQCPRDQATLLCWWEVTPLEQKLRMFPNIFTEICLNKL